jgi:Carboxypeptidase regulatory-like domain/FlgD Ig-like domain
MKNVTWRVFVLIGLTLLMASSLFAKPIELDPPPVVPETYTYQVDYPNNLNPGSFPSQQNGLTLDDMGYFTELVSWDFESGDPWSPQYRTGSVLPGGAYWHVDSWNGYSGSLSWWCGVNAPAISNNGYADNWLQFLETPSLNLNQGATSIIFQFMMKAYLEGGAFHPNFNSWDACNVWYSIDDGATWQVLNSPSLAYNSSSNYAFGQNQGYYYDSGAGMIGTPIPGWMGNITGGNYVPVQFDLSSLIGQTNVKFRFGFASDQTESAENYSAYLGMFVDDIIISDNNSTVYLQNNADGTAFPTDLIPIAQIESEWVLTETTSNSATHAWHMPNDKNVLHMLTSPQFTIPTGVTTDMSYNVWCDMPDVNSNGGVVDDYYEVLLSINGGLSWYRIANDWSTRPSPDGISLDGWVYRNHGDDNGSKILDLTPYAGYTVSLAYRVRTDFDDDDGVGTGIYIDDVSIFTYEGFVDYVWEPTEYNWIELADDPDAQQINFTSPSNRAIVDIINGHSFEFPNYENILSRLRIGARGVIYQNGNNCDIPPLSLGYYANNSGVIAPLWTDMSWDERDESAAYVKNVGGNLIVEWFLPHLQYNPDWPMIFQTHLFPDGRIEYHYQELPEPEFIHETSPLVIGVNNINRSRWVELYPEMNFVPTNETAVALVPGMYSYGGLEITVIDEETTLPVPNLTLFIPELNLYPVTNASGIALIEHIPTHAVSQVEIRVFGDHYVHQGLMVDLVPNGMASAQLNVQPLLRPATNVVVNDDFEAQINLSWNAPNTTYSLASINTYEEGDWGWNYFENENIGQGVDFSIYEMEGLFDLESVDCYLMNYHGYFNDYNHRPLFRVDVWDVSNHDSPILIHQTTVEPTQAYGWFNVPIGLLGLESPDFAVTITTPNQSGNMAYNLCNDMENNFGADIFGDLDDTPPEFIHNHMNGDMVMAANLRFNGHYELTPPAENINTEPNMAVFNKEARDGDLVRFGFEPCLNPIQNITSEVFNPNIQTIYGPQLDSFTGSVAYYKIYRDGAIHDSTANGTTYSYLDTGLIEGTEYLYEIAPQYNYDGNLIEGPKTPHIPATPMMAPDKPYGNNLDGKPSVLVENETIDGGDLTIGWVPPTLNVDGTPLTDLAGYKIFLNGDFETVVAEPIATDTTFTLALPRGYYNPYIVAVDHVGNISYTWYYDYHWVGTEDLVLDFEADDSGFQSNGFDWGTPTAGPASGYDGSTNLWGINLDGYYNNESLYRMKTPPLHVGDSDCWVTFQQWYDFETGYDGGVIKITADDGQSWEVVDMSSDRSLYFHPYWGHAYNNPISEMIPEGMGVITGSSGDMLLSNEEGWFQRGVDLSAYAGQDVVLAFIAGTDAANNLHHGWYIDNMAFSNVSFSPTGSIAGTVTDNSTSMPMEDVIVTAGNWNAMTDASGSYEFSGLLLGDYAVEAWIEGYNLFEITTTVEDGIVTPLNIALTHPVLTPGVTEIIIDVHPGYNGLYNLAITNDGDGPLAVFPDVVEHWESLTFVPPPDEGGMFDSYNYREAVLSETRNNNLELDDYGMIVDVFNPPSTFEAMNGVALDEISGLIYLTDQQTPGIHVINPQTSNLEFIIPTPYAPANEEMETPFPGSVEIIGSDLWFSWHEWVLTPEDDEREGAFRTHIVRIIDPETGEFDVEFISWDMGWYGPIQFFEIFPDYNGFIFTGYNYDYEVNMFGFTSPVADVDGNWLEPTVSILRYFPAHAARGLELADDGNLWLISRNYENEFAMPILFEITMPDMTISAQIPIHAQNESVAGIDFTPDGHLIVVDQWEGLIVEVGYGHPFFSPQESRYYFAPANTSDIVFNVRIPEYLEIGTTIELTTLLFNNGLPNPVEIPVILNVVEPVFQREIVLNAGWNLVSADVMPLNPDVDLQLTEIFAYENANDNLVLVKNGDGEFYDPTSGLNQIGEWDPLQGYKVNVIEPTVVLMSGHNIFDGTPIEMFDGWNMVSYLPNMPINAYQALGSIEDDLIIAKDGEGRFFLPEFGYNGIGDMMPQYGYQVKVDGDATLVYPHGYMVSSQVAATSSSEEPKHFVCTTEKSNQNFSILITSAEIDGQKISSGDEIGIFSSNGRLYTSAIWNDTGKAGFSIWADDPNTEIVEGLPSDDQVRVKVWHAGDDQVVPMAIELIAGNRDRTTDGYMVAKLSGTMEGIIPETYFLSQNYPNPFNPSTTIKYGLPDNATVHLDIFNVLGQSVAKLVSQEQRAGFYSVTWNGLNYSGETVSSGVYFYRLQAGSFTSMHKMVVTK